MILDVPGKLFLMGEYAVLYGGPAVVAAVDRYVQVRRSDGTYEVVGAETERRLPELVAKFLADVDTDDAHLTTGTIDELEVDVSALRGPAGKLGLGSSAASTVALVRALRPDYSPREVFDAAYSVHRRFQGGKGSGGDIAASTFGGILEYRMPREHLDEEFMNGDEKIRALALPQKIRIEPVWTGASTKTVSMMRRVRAAMGPDLRSIFEAIGESAREAIYAARKDDGSSFLRAFARADELAGDLGEAADIPIVTKAHEELREQVNRFGFHAKPSGAGGGEFSLVAGPPGEEWDYFLGGLHEPLRHYDLTLGALA